MVVRSRLCIYYNLRYYDYILELLPGHSLTWAPKRILFSQTSIVVESNCVQGCLTELTFIFLNIYTAVVDT
jgi:hypothetical protein